jgi:hypothetical protein
MAFWLMIVLMPILLFLVFGVPILLIRYFWRKIK